MRLSLLLPLLLTAAFAQARTVVRINAPAFRDRPVLVLRYMDLFTLRTEPLLAARTDAQGGVVLELDVHTRTRAQLRIGEGRTDLYLEPGANYDVIFQRLQGSALTLAGTNNAELIFNNLDALDVNALTSDLNERLDAFVATGLATDQAGGMNAVDAARKGGTAPRDSTAGGMPYTTPTWTEAQVDSFGDKLRRFYAGVGDPWFDALVEYGVGTLKFGPRANDKKLYERYLKDRPARYDNPEYVRFVRGLFEDHLMRFPFRTDEQRLLTAVAAGDADSVKAVFAQHDFLAHDDRLCELVMMQELYANHPGKVLDRGGVRKVLDRIAHGSAHPEHRLIATDMLWDLTAMRPGAPLPTLTLHTMDGAPVDLDSLVRKGPVLLAFTAAWCTYCEMEMAALEKLYAEHANTLTFIGIGMDPGMEAMQAYLRLHPARKWTWLYAGDDLRTMDQLRMRSLPQFMLLSDGILTHAPAPLPSQGLPGMLHRMKVEEQEKGRITPGSEQPPPKPPQR